MLFEAMQTGQQRQNTVTMKVELVHRGSCCAPGIRSERNVQQPSSRRRTKT
jgi:hypothetical protein